MPNEVNADRIALSNGNIGTENTTQNGDWQPNSKKYKNCTQM